MTHDHAGLRGSPKPRRRRALRSARTGWPRHASSASACGLPPNSSSPPAPVSTRSAPWARARARSSSSIGIDENGTGTASIPVVSSEIRGAASSGATRMTSHPRWRSSAARCGRSSPGPSKSRLTANAEPPVRFAHSVARPISTEESSPPPVMTATRRTPTSAASTASVSARRRNAAASARAGAACGRSRGGVVT